MELRASSAIAEAKEYGEDRPNLALKQARQQLFIRSQRLGWQSRWAEPLRKVPGARRAGNLLSHSLNPGLVKVNVQGLKMFVDAGSSGVGLGLVRSGNWEAYESRLFERSIKPGMVVADIGANLGHYTLLAAKSVCTEGHVYAFEPHPRNFELLVKNIQLNDLSERVTPLPMAVSDKEGTISLFFRSDLGHPSLNQENLPRQLESDPGQEVEVQTTTLHKVIHEGSLDVIKMDAQGAEGMIVNGSPELFSNGAKRCFVEFWPYGLKNLGTDPRALLSLFSNWNFATYLVDSAKRELVKAEDPDDILDRCSGKWEFVDLMLERD